MAMQDEHESRAKKPARPKDFTSRLPMINLETAIKVVRTIRDKGLEVAPALTVAKALGYKTPTSSPFYTRMLGARLFGLLSGKSTLAQRAIDFLKPRDEQMKQAALVDAIMGIPPYKSLVELYAGKKINIEHAANKIETEHSLTQACATVCAKVFEASLRFAGMLAADDVVEARPIGSRPEAQPEEPAGVPTAANGMPSMEPAAEGGQDTQQHTLYLDKGKVRKFYFAGPVEVTQQEYERICQWLKVTMIVAEKTEGGGQ